MLDPVRILQSLIEHLNENDIEGERMEYMKPEYIEGEEDEAEARINWGGRDLFDITIKRV